MESYDPTPLDFLFIFLSPQVAPKVVQADVANVLRHSRFAKHFHISDAPQDPESGTSDPYSNADPFAYTATSKNSGSGCCAKKPVKAQQGTGCCGSKRTGEEGKKKCC